MRVGGISAAPIRLSSNQLISSLNGARPTASASPAEEIDGVESLGAIEEIQGEQQKPKTPYQGPGVADLTPKSSLRPPPGFFKQESASNPEQKADRQPEQQEARSRQEGAASDLATEKGIDGEPLTEEQRDEVQDLKKRDAEVVAHENAHLAAAGGLARGGPNYDYDKGPDGRQYRVGGHVTIDTSKGKTPEETIQKAQTIRRAALAPAEPSGQDRAVANEAAQMEAEARSELTTERVQSGNEDSQNPAAQEASRQSEAPTSEQRAQATQTASKLGPESSQADNKVEDLIQASVSGSFSQTGRLETKASNPSSFVVKNAMQSYAANLNYTQAVKQEAKVVAAAPKVLRAPTPSLVSNLRA